MDIDSIYDAIEERQNMQIEDEQRGLLTRHLEMVIETNKQFNLTTVNTMDDGMILHVEDSLCSLEDVLGSGEPFCDIGTGAGYPGIPIAIMSGYQGILIDSIRKKSDAVRRFTEELGLEGILKVEQSRSEELAEKEPGMYQTVIARAVAEMSILLEYASPLLKIGGKFISMKGTPDKQEIDHSNYVAEIVGLCEVERRECIIGIQGYRRTLFIYEKTKESDIDLPRRAGMARKKPL